MNFIALSFGGHRFFCGGISPTALCFARCKFHSAKTGLGSPGRRLGVGPGVESEKKRDDVVEDFQLHFLQPSLRVSDLISSHGHLSSSLISGDCWTRCLWFQSCICIFPAPSWCAFVVLHNLGDYNTYERGRMDKFLTLVYLPWFLAVKMLRKISKGLCSSCRERGEMEWSLRHSALGIQIWALVPARPSTSYWL